MTPTHSIRAHEQGKGSYFNYFNRDLQSLMSRIDCEIFIVYFNIYFLNASNICLFLLQIDLHELILLQ